MKKTIQKVRTQKNNATQPSVKNDEGRFDFDNQWGYVDDEPEIASFTSQYEGDYDHRFFN